jgi:hypothetical protein
MCAFAGGALVGAHAKAGASSPGLVSSTASSHVVQPRPPAGSCRAPNDPRNLWQIGSHPPPIPNLKDELAGRPRKRVCGGEMPLATAQSLIARDWVAAYRRYG